VGSKLSERDDARTALIGAVRALCGEHKNCDEVKVSSKPLAVPATAASVDLSQRIDSLYRRLAALVEARAAGGAVAVDEGQIDAVKLELDGALDDEAKMVTQLLDDRLRMPRGAGQQALAAADEVLGKYADTASDHEPASDAR
jgi:hypothetical protein